MNDAYAYPKFGSSKNVAGCRCAEPPGEYQCWSCPKLRMKESEVSKFNVGAKVVRNPGRDDAAEWPGEWTVVEIAANTDVIRVRGDQSDYLWASAAHFIHAPHVVKASEPVNGWDAMAAAALHNPLSAAQHALGVKAGIADNVYRPHHYARYTIEPVTFIEANKLPYAVGNVVKYILRYDAKNGKEDVKKAIRYCEIILEGIEREERIKAGADPKVTWVSTL